LNSKFKEELDLLKTEIVALKEEILKLKTPSPLYNTIPTKDGYKALPVDEETFLNATISLPLSTVSLSSSQAFMEKYQKKLKEKQFPSSNISQSTSHPY
jgi:hypothetical protein